MYVKLRAEASFKKAAAGGQGLEKRKEVKEEKEREG